MLTILKSQKKKKLEPGSALSFNNGNFFLLSHICIGEIIKNGSEYNLLNKFLTGCMPLTRNKNNIFFKLIELNSINSNGIAVGMAETIYGEKHAIIFTPKN